MKKIIIGVGVVVLLVVGGYAVTHNSPSEEAEAAVKIGVVLPLSGQYVSIGESAQKAIELAFAGDERVELIIEDSQFDTKKAISSYHKLTDVDQVDMLITLFTITSLEVIDDLIAEDGVLTLQIAESHEHNDDTIFQVMPFSYPSLARLGEMSDERYSKVAVVRNNDQAGLKNSEYFKRTFPEEKIVTESVLSQNSDYKTEVTKLLEQDPEAVAFFLTEEEGIKFLKEFATQRGEKDVALICNALMEISVAKYVEIFGEELFEGCISANIPVTTTDEFIATFKEAYDADPTFATDYSYDAALIARELLAEPKSSWLDSVQQISIDGASGNIEFDTSGTRVPVIEDRIFRNGEFEKLSPK